MSDIGLKYVIDLKIAHNFWGKLRPYVLEFQPDGDFSWYNKPISIDELAEKRIRELGLKEAPADFDSRFVTLYKIGDDKAGHLPLIGNKRYSILPREAFCQSLEISAEEILHKLGRPKDVVLKHRNMSRGEGVYYVEDAKTNLATILERARGANLPDKLAVFRYSQNGFVVQEGLTSPPINLDGAIVKNPKQSDSGKLFDATMRYVIIVQISEYRKFKVHSVDGYWKLPLHPNDAKTDANLRKISGGDAKDRQHSKSAPLQPQQLDWLEQYFNPKLAKLFSDIVTTDQSQNLGIRKR